MNTCWVELRTSQIMRRINSQINRLFKWNKLRIINLDTDIIFYTWCVWHHELGKYDRFYKLGSGIKERILAQLSPSLLCTRQINMLISCLIKVQYLWYRPITEWWEILWGSSEMMQNDDREREPPDTASDSLVTCSPRMGIYRMPQMVGGLSLHESWLSTGDTSFPGETPLRHSQWVKGARVVFLNPSQCTDNIAIGFEARPKHLHLNLSRGSTKPNLWCARKSFPYSSAWILTTTIEE